MYPAPPTTRTANFALPYFFALDGLSLDFSRDRRELAGIHQCETCRGTQFVELRSTGQPGAAIPTWLGATNSKARRLGEERAPDSYRRPNYVRTSRSDQTGDA